MKKGGEVALVASPPFGKCRYYLANASALDEVYNTQQDDCANRGGHEVHDPSGVGREEAGYIADAAADQAADDANHDVPEDAH